MIATQKAKLSFRTEQADVFAFPIHSDESVSLWREKSLFDLNLAHYCSDSTRPVGSSFSSGADFVYA